MTAVVALAVPWISAAGFGALDARRRWVGWAAAAVLALHVALLAWLGAQVLLDGPQDIVTGGWAPGVGIVLHVDALGVAFAFVSSTCLLLSLVHELLDGPESRVFPALVLFAAAGLTGLFFTGDVFNFFVFFELSMISAYALAVHGGEAPQIRAAFVFAVVNLLGSFVFLIAVAAIYHVTGALEMGTVAARMDEVEPNSVILIAVAVFVAFGVKLGLFPFHFWLPPVYTGARPAVAAILSGAIANIGPYGLIRFGGAILPAELEIGATVLAAVGGASILYGSMQAMARRATTEVLAYSSIGQNGYVLLALAVGGPLGFTAAIVYSLVNALNKTVLFFAAGARGRLVGAAFVIGAFSVVGVPPTAGFFAKVELFLAGIETGRYALVSLVVIGGALSFLYMFQIYQHDYWRSRDGVRFGMRLQLLVFAVAAFILALGLWPEPLLRLTEHAVEGVLR